MTADQAAAHYSVNALGFTANLGFPAREVGPRPQVFQGVFQPIDVPGPLAADRRLSPLLTVGLGQTRTEHHMSTGKAARTYNQDHVPRKYKSGKRRVSIYWTWSYPWEANRDPSIMDNRFSTFTEVRRVAWPEYETREWDEQAFLQGIAGTLELFHRSTLSFQQLVGEATDQPVAVFQRIDQAGYRQPIDERILADTDTLMVFGLDHLLAEQEATPEEIAALREWLKREGTCLLIGPHHDVGFAADLKQRQMEYKHHGDPLVPRQQRFGQYTRSLMKGLNVPVINQYGLRPAVVKGTNQIAPLHTNQRPRRPGPPAQCHHLQLSSPPAPLRPDQRRHLVGAGPLLPGDRPGPAAPLYCGGQHRIQLLHLDATSVRPRRRYPDGRLDHLHYAIRWHPKSGEFLAEPRADETN